ncbi:MAG: hypothetical protein WC869_03840 [Phycisphaerae bacterium]|jgi:hypothetical protein
MTPKITFTDEQMQELRQLLQKELDNTLVELHRTDAWEFKQRVQHRIDLLKGILAATETHTKATA